jgi:transposase
MSRRTEALRLKVVVGYLAGQWSTAEAAALHGVSPSTVKRWLALYRVHGENGLRRRPNRCYDGAFKLAVVQCLRKECLSQQEVALRFELRDLAVVGQWARRYDEGGAQALQPRRKGRPPTMRKPPLTPPVPTPVDDEHRSRDELINELRWLRMENDYLKKLDALVQAKQTAAPRKKRS